MIRLRLGPLPVDIRPSHWVLSLLLGWGFAQQPSPFGWPTGLFSAQAVDAGPPSGSLVLALAMLWMLMISFSVFIHELGHAAAGLAFGYRPHIHLVGLGGLTQTNPNETVPWYRDVLLTLAGPLFGLMLSLAFGMGRLALDVFGVPDGLVRYAFDGMFWANLAWSIFNLFPIMPLDGGKIATAISMRVFGRVGFLFSHVLGLLLCVLGFAFAMARGGHPIMVVLFAMYAFFSLSRTTAYFKGVLPEAENQKHPFELAVERAEALMARQDFAQAERILDAVLAEHAQSALREKALLLKGTAALKLGEGTRALEAFQKLPEGRVAPHYVAAALSLSGDDERAVGYWEKAAQAVPDATLRHEWAGALIRLARIDEAKALPGITWALAKDCALSVLEIRGDKDAAARIGQLCDESPQGVSDVTAR